MIISQRKHIRTALYKDYKTFFERETHVSDKKTFFLRSSLFILAFCLLPFYHYLFSPLNQRFDLKWKSGYHINKFTVLNSKFTSSTILIFCLLELQIAQNCTCKQMGWCWHTSPMAKKYLQLCDQYCGHWDLSWDSLPKVIWTHWFFNSLD